MYSHVLVLISECVCNTRIRRDSSLSRSKLIIGYILARKSDSSPRQSFAYERLTESVSIKLSTGLTNPFLLAISSVIQNLQSELRRRRILIFYVKAISTDKM